MLWLMTMLMACGDEQEDTGLDLDADFDGDGWSINDGDCNDFDAALHPGAEEVCDKMDNDCNGASDDYCE